MPNCNLDRARSGAHLGGWRKLGTELPLGRSGRLLFWEDQMSRFIAGVVLGCFLSIMSNALAARVLGTGKLSGWTVVDEGEEVILIPT